MRITWHFNTSLASHHGGLWEAAVKSFKYHLNRVTGPATLTFEKIGFLLVRIEACLNSRPLLTPTDEPTDLTVIAPGHLLTGRQVLKPLGPEMLSMPIDSIAWNKIRVVEEDIWQRWSAEYLTELQTRNKWLETKRNIKENDLVILQNENMLQDNGRAVELPSCFQRPARSSCERENACRRV